MFSIYMMVIQDLAKTRHDLKFKMAVMPIYGKKHSNDFFSKTTGLIWLIFCKKHMGSQGSDTGLNGPLVLDLDYL